VIVDWMKIFALVFYRHLQLGCMMMFVPVLMNVKELLDEIDE
jgi:hypothetical protein